jgi:hypothetical protein
MNAINTILLCNLFLLSSSLTSQTFPSPVFTLETQSVQQTKHKINSVKAPGAILYYEDFDSTGRSSNNHLPQGWITSNNNGNCLWVWSDAAPGGQYTSANALNSTSDTNGFISLRMDFCNTPIPIGGATSMDAVIQSNKLTLSATAAAVLLRWEQSIRYCCSGSNKLVVELSLNGTSWQTLDATAGLPPNVSTANPQQMELNVSNILGNQRDFYIRFKATGSTHYYWMIDDLQVVEGYTHSLINEGSLVNFHPGIFSGISSINYTIVPQNLLDSVVFETYLTNNGSQGLNNVSALNQVYHDSTLQGNPGSGLVYQTPSDTIANLPMLGKDTVNNQQHGFKALSTGHYRYRSTFTATQSSQTPTTIYEYRFTVDDSTWARDYNVFSGASGPSVYQGGGNDGDRWMSLFHTGSDTAVATSISLFVSNDTTNVGSTIDPQIWNGTATNKVGGSVFNYTITTNDLGNWIVLPLFPKVTLDPDSFYMVGWEQVSGANNGNNFRAGRVPGDGSPHSRLRSAMYINGANNPGWYNSDQLAGIRINFDPTHPGNKRILIGENEQTTIADKLVIYPNPAPGNIQLQLPLKHTFKKIEVVNIRGKVVLQKEITPEATTRLNLAHLPPGIYLLRIAGKDSTFIKKLVLQ